MRNAVEKQQNQKNALLASLPAAEYESLRPSLTPVFLKLATVVYGSNETVRHVYFPTSSIISLLYVMGDGATAQIAMVGKEGVVGFSAFMGGGSTSSRAVVQVPGDALRLTVKVVNKRFACSAAMKHLLLLHTQAMMAEMAQTAACNRHHTVAQRWCRSLLMTLDRLPHNRVAMRQGPIAKMVGIGPECITLARTLAAAGVIEYSAGTVIVLDRLAVEHHSCNCYAVVRNEFARLLPSMKAS